MSALSLYNLCAAKWSYLIVDAIAVIFLLGYIIVCAKKGFVSCFFGLISTMVALIVALSLAKPVLNLTGGLFGLHGKLETTFIGTFEKVEAFNTGISPGSLEIALEEQNMPGILINLVVKWVNTSEIPEGTTLAMVLGQVTGKALSLLITAAALFILCKLIFLILKSVLNGIIENISLLGAVNGVLGAAIGLLQGALTVCTIIAFITLLPIKGLDEFISNCVVVKFLYEKNFIISLTGMFL